MKKQEKSKGKMVYIVKEHIKKNIKEYASVSIIFLIGIIIGVIFINNIREEEKMQITDYLNTFIECLNGDYEIDNSKFLKSSIINNLLLALILWFIGSTVIGIPIVYIIIGVKGFCLGYTISSVMITYSMWKAILFNICTLLLQNIILIPCILSLAVSGIKLYKSIIKDKRTHNIKVEIARHTIFSLFISIFLVLASFLEVYGSTNLLMLCIKCFT